MTTPVQSRRPKLSLQTKPIQHGPGVRSRTSYGDPKSPTAFNTLSNVYVTAIERSTPTQCTPLTAIRIRQPLTLRTDSETLQANQLRVETPSTALPDTPLSANPFSPTQRREIVYPSTMTPTPPLSAGAIDSGKRVFTFTPIDTNHQRMLSPPAKSSRRVSFASSSTIVKAPYSHNRSLHSILRNSPLQSSSAKSPGGSRRQSVRLQERAARRVGYESPLTRTITTEKYTKSHIDLLVEEASPYTPSPVLDDSDIDLTIAYSGDEITDGGQTPGPFEDMRRRMTGLGTEALVLSPKSDGIQRRRRREKKRKWVWTIGRDDEEGECDTLAALRAAAGETTPRATTAPADMPEPLTAIEVSIERAEPESSPTTSADEERMDVDTSEASSVQSSRATSPCSTDCGSKRPTTDDGDLVSREESPPKRQRLASIDSTDDGETSSRLDTPVPADIGGALV
ncbi:putative glucan -alpha-glucosidase [Rosellinia necatrix]|uniref:Putative glucan-alpha-glucosidase n=1 Tax=Rosellinia necatrix TaxID=77044 RepID=A0A1W2TUR4_ROSNE|nr:putative glucan -alpha-glucosidase [Rosellinia necatrix]